MKLVKSLMLGSAAGLIAMSGAQAADLPVKAKAVEYVRICSLYGAGFWYIPGTDTCIKIGGYLRVDSTYNGSTVYDAPAYSGDAGQGNRFKDHFDSRSRLALTVDTRTATEYGVVRTFGQGDFQFQNFGTSNPSVISAAPSVLGGLNNATLSSAGGGYVAVEYVFIQFAGFTFGKSSSAFATPWNGYPGNNTSFLIGGHDTVTGVNNIQYQAQFGNGVSATVGLDDPTVFNRTPLYNLGLGLGAPFTGGVGRISGLVGSNAYGGWVMPDVVGNVRVDQAWGLFQVSGALHMVNASYNALGAGGTPLNSPAAGALSTSFNNSVLSGHPDDKLGGAVMLALQIKNLPTGPGDDFKIDGTWAKGDTKEVISTSGGSPSFAMLGGVPGQFGSSGSIAFGPTNDGVYLPTNPFTGSVLSGGDDKIHLTTAYGVRGAFNHNWDPYWSTSLWGGAGWVRFDNTGKSEFCAALGVALPGQGTTYSCDPNYTAAMAGVVTRWTPVKNFTFSAEVSWFHLSSSMSGFSTFSPGAPQPTQTWTFKDQDTMALNVRVQRNF